MMSVSITSIFIPECLGYCGNLHQFSQIRKLAGLKGPTRRRTSNTLVVYSITLLTLAMLNKLRCPSTSNFKPISLFEPTHTDNDKQCRSRKKPTVLGLHCLQSQGISWFSRTRVKNTYLFYLYFYKILSKI